MGAGPRTRFTSAVHLVTASWYERQIKLANFKVGAHVLARAGINFSLAGEHRKAWETLSRAVEAGSTNVDAWAQLGWTCLALYDSEAHGSRRSLLFQAKACFTRALRSLRTAADLAIWNGLARANLHIGAHDEVVAMLGPCIEQFTASSHRGDAMLLVANAFAVQGCDRQACIYLKQLVADGAGAAGVTRRDLAFLLGHFWRRQGAVGRAAQCFRSSGLPEDAVASWEGLAVRMRRARQPALALSLLRAVANREEGTANPATWLGIAHCSFDVGDVSAALDALAHTRDAQRVASGRRPRSRRAQRRRLPTRQQKKGRWDGRKARAGTQEGSESEDEDEDEDEEDEDEEDEDEESSSSGNDEDDDEGGSRPPSQGRSPGDPPQRVQRQGLGGGEALPPGPSVGEVRRLRRAWRRVLRQDRARARRRAKEQRVAQEAKELERRLRAVGQLPSDSEEEEEEEEEEETGGDEGRGGDRDESNAAGARRGQRPSMVGPAPVKAKGAPRRAGLFRLLATVARRKGAQPGPATAETDEGEEVDEAQGAGSPPGAVEPTPEIAAPADEGDAPEYGGEAEAVTETGVQGQQQQEPVSAAPPLSKEEEEEEEEKEAPVPDPMEAALYVVDLSSAVDGRQAAAGPGEGGGDNGSAAPPPDGGGGGGSGFDGGDSGGGGWGEGGGDGGGAGGGHGGGGGDAGGGGGDGDDPYGGAGHGGGPDDGTPAPAGWRKEIDAETGWVYYVNEETGEKSWTLPLDAPAGGSDALPDGWSTVVDPSTGTPYYAHSPSGTTQWERPGTGASAMSWSAWPQQGESTGQSYWADPTTGGPQWADGSGMDVRPDTAATDTSAAPAAPAAPASSLPAGWEAAVDPNSGLTYYAHPASGRAQWEVPRAADTPPPGLADAVQLTPAAQKAAHQADAEAFAYAQRKAQEANETWKPDVASLPKRSKRRAADRVPPTWEAQGDPAAEEAALHDGTEAPRSGEREESPRRGQRRSYAAEAFASTPSDGPPTSPLRDTEGLVDTSPGARGGALVEFTEGGTPHTGRRRSMSHHGGSLSETDFEEPAFEGQDDVTMLGAVNSADPTDPSPLADYASFLLMQGSHERAEFYLGRAIVVADRYTDTSTHGALRARLLRLQATIHTTKHKFSRADACYQRALAESPGAVATRLAFARFLARIRDDSRAEEQLLHAVVHGQRHPVPLREYALFLWRKRRDLDKAHNYLSRAVGAAREGGTPELHATCLRTLAAFLRDEMNDVSGAQKRLLLSSRLLPQSPDALSELGELLLLQGDAEAAAGYYWRALEIDAGHHPSLLALAKIKAASQSSRDHATAESLFRRVLRLDPEHPGTLLACAQFLELSRGDTDGAREMYDRVAAVARNDPEVALARGQFLDMTLGEHEDALPHYERATALAPRNVATLLTLGQFVDVVCDEGGRAEALFRRVLELCPTHPMALRSLSNVLAAAGDYDEAEECYERALEAAPDDVQTLRCFAMFCFGVLGNAVRAKALLHRACEVDGGHGPSLTALGLLLMQGRSSARAERVLERAAAVDPLAVEPRLAIAQLYDARVKHPSSRRGGAVAADTAYRQALKVNADHVPTLLRYGAFLGRSRRNRQRAAECFSRAIAVDPGNPNCHYSFALFLQYGERDYERARSHYIRSLALDSRNVLAHYHLGALAEASGDFVQAEENYLRSLDLAPEATRGQHEELLRRVRQAYERAERRFMEEQAPGSDKTLTQSLVLHQRLHKYAMLKAVYDARMGEAGGERDADLGVQGRGDSPARRRMDDKAFAGSQSGALDRWHTRSYFASFLRHRDRLTFAQGRMEAEAEAEEEVEGGVVATRSSALPRPGSASKPLAGSGVAVAREKRRRGAPPSDKRGGSVTVSPLSPAPGPSSQRARTMSQSGLPSVGVRPQSSFGLDPAPRRYGRRVSGASLPGSRRNGVRSGSIPFPEQQRGRVLSAEEWDDFPGASGVLSPQARQEGSVRSYSHASDAVLEAGPPSPLGEGLTGAPGSRPGPRKSRVEQVRRAT